MTDTPMALSRSIERIRVLAQQSRGAVVDHRSAATELGVSEGQFIAAHVGLPHANTGARVQAHRLAPDWREICRFATALKPLTLETVNATCRLIESEYNGQSNIVPLAPIGDRSARHCFAVSERLGSSIQTSLNLFDARGEAVQRFILTPDSDRLMLERLMERFTAADQHPGLAAIAPVKPQPPCRRERRGYVQQVASDIAQLLLSRVAQLGLPISICVDRNPQIHELSGRLDRIRLQRSSNQREHCEWRLLIDELFYESQLVEY